MKTIFFSISCMLLFCASIFAQDKTANSKSVSMLPYYEIPPYPVAYTAGNIAARMVDGLGFRYHWATEGLREEDLRFKPSAEARTSLETLRHIYGLSKIIVNSTRNKSVNSGAADPELTFVELRQNTLNNFKSASDRLKSASEKDLSDFKIIFEQDGKRLEFPFWNQLNGPIADALWHVGQVVSFRRSSGNPFDEKVNVFEGKYE